MRRELGLILVAMLAGFFVGCGGESIASTSATPTAAAPISAADKPAEGLAVEPASESHVAAAEPGSACESAPTKPAETPTAPKGKRPPADRTPRRPGEAEKITFDDLNLGMAADMVFRPFLLTDRVKELDGQRVSILGFIHAGADRKKAKEFVLLKNTECKFGKDGQADHLAMVYLAPGVTTDFTTDAIKVEGVLKVKPFEGADGNTWSVYDLQEAKVVR
ncbi:MAG: hypothetical protein SFU86_22815 [Pirellulaceae bacterium]|nr:hypothetical protein [Pirellulaceae bacterium]